MAAPALQPDEREEIRAGVARGESGRAIASRLGRNPSTISRELRRNGGRHRYVAAQAQRRCDRMRRRPKTPKLIADRRLALQVEKGLQLGFSPMSISALLRAAGGERVSHETIYRALYSSTFQGIRLLPHTCLRTRRRRRLARSRKRSGTRAPFLQKGFRLIDARPASVADRREPGHWEGDLVLGSRLSGSAVITLVERTSRRLLLGPLFGGYGSWEVCELVAELLGQEPAAMRKSLTWDQGTEMYHWPRVEQALKMPVFFCHRRSPWERGSNENANRQLRFWLRKGTDITAHPPGYFERIAFVLNHQPRRILAWSSADARYRSLLPMP